MNFFEALRPIAESVNMGWYFDQLQQECEQKWHSREIERKFSMKQILEENAPKDGEILLVNAKTGYERKAFHAWAESKGYHHAPLRTDEFTSNIAFYCEECEKTFYDSEMSSYLDWSTITPGVCYGSTIKCRECNSIYDSECDSWEAEIKRRGECFNAVIIGKVLPKLSKRETRKRNRKTPIMESENDLQLLNEIGKRAIKIISLEDFGDTLEIEGKKYPRLI